MLKAGNIRPTIGTSIDGKSFKNIVKFNIYNLFTIND